MPPPPTDPAQISAAATLQQSFQALLAAEGLSDHLPSLHEQALQQAYQRVLPRLNALSVKEILNPALPVADAVVLGFQLYLQIQKDLPRLKKLVSIGELSAECLEQLETLVLALLYAELLWQNARALKLPKSEKADVSSAKFARQELLSAADYVWRHDERTKKYLKQIREGSSLQDLADDLSALVILFRQSWELIAGQSQITLEDLESASQHAERVLHTVLLKEQQETHQQRNRAYTLFHLAYQSLFAAGRFLHHFEKQSALLYPALRPLAPRTKGAPASSVPIPPAQS